MKTTVYKVFFFTVAPKLKIFIYLVFSKRSKTLTAKYVHIYIFFKPNFLIAQTVIYRSVLPLTFIAVRYLV